MRDPIGKRAVGKISEIENVLDIAEARGVKISGWQELVMDLEDHVYERMKKNLYSINITHPQKQHPEILKAKLAVKVQRIPIPKL